MATTLSVAYTATPLPAGIKLIAYATPQLSPGINFVSPSQYRFVQVSAAAAASPLNALAAYNALFGALVAGKKIFFRLVPISAEGFKGTPIETSVIVT